MLLFCMATRNEKEVKKVYPVVEGLTAGTTKQTGNRFLVAENTTVRKREMKGLYG